MPIALIGIGIPGSGKTTFLKELAARYDLVYINKDDLRAELLGDANDQSQNRQIWLESERRISEALQSGKHVVLDATYAERWKREELIASLKKRGALRVIGLYFNIPFAQALRQNLARERVVAAKDMEWFRKKLEAEPPEMTEGYDVLYDAHSLDQVERELTA